MRSPRNAFSSIFDNPVLVGTVTILVVLVAVYLSYIAENGLPFIPTYSINVQVADGGELNKNNDVRIGGARVGQILKITPEPANKRYGQPFAQLQLALDKNLEPLPDTTTYQVRLSSVLGGQYLELFPGRKTRGVATVPDGGTLVIADAAKQNHNIPYVDFSQALDVFGPKTQAGIRSVAQGLGNAFAGRGTSLNDGITATAQLLPPFKSVLDILSAPDTELSRFISGLDSTTRALAPEADRLNDLLGHAATTFGALDHPALGRALDELPSTEQVGTTVFTRATPVFAELASITRELRPAAVYLPTAAARIDTALREAPPTLRLVSPVSTKIEATLAAANTLARDPAATQTFNLLGVNDLGTTGASAFVGLGAILNTASAAQFQCNVTGLWVRNFASSLSEGDSESNWLRIATIIDPTQLIQSANVASNLHINTNPQEGDGQCQAGNEVYSGAQAINSPGTTSAAFDNTTPPAGVLAEGQNAGLVPK